MRILLALLLSLLALPAHAATYLLLSQTNNVIAAATNSAKAYTDAHNAGASPWTNISGTILPVAGQTTNTLRFTSGLSDNATNVAMLVNTVSNWTGGSLLTLENAGTRRLAVDYGGGIYAGTFNNVSDFDGILDVSLLNQHDLAAGEYPNLFMRQAIYADATSTNRLLGQSMSVLSVSGSDTNNWTNFQQDLHLITITNYALAGEIEVKNDPANGSAISMTSGTFSSGLGNSWWAPDRSDTFLAIHDVQRGEVANAFATVGVVDDSSSPTNGTTASLQTRLASGAQMILSDIPGGNPYRAIANASDTSLYFLLESPGGTLFAAQPTIANGTTAYIMDTTVAHTSNYLATVSNNGTNKFTIDYTGNVSAAGTVTTPALNVGTITYTNPPALPTFTVATLPGANTNTGSQVWVTDALTPFGGSQIFYSDGSVWRGTASKIAATTDLRTYMENAAKVGWSGETLSDISATALGFAYGSFHFGANSAGESLTIFQDVPYCSITRSTTATGGASYGDTVPPATNTLTALACSGRFWVSTLADTTDSYFYCYGFMSTITTNAPVAGVYLLYDCINLTGHNQAYTNDWILVTAHGSAYTYSDTGLAVTSTGPGDRLWLYWDSARAIAYTNGVAATTNVAHLTTTAPMFFGEKFVKSAGNTGRAMNHQFLRYHFRRGTTFNTF